MKNLLLFAVFILVESVAFGQGTASGQETAAPAAARELQVFSDIDFSHLQVRPQFKWGFDPFLKKPGFATVDPETDVIRPDKFTLDAIIFDAEDPVAVINGRTLGIGDSILGLSIETISSNYVTLKGQGHHFELVIPPAREPARAAEIEPVSPKKGKPQ